MSSAGARASRGAARARIVAVIVFTILVASFRAFDADDAAISFRHARNLANGHGPVMNPGERVEGVSNLPWTIVLGLATGLGCTPDGTARVLAFACGVAAVLLSGMLANRLGGDAIAIATAMLLAASCAPLAAWSAVGMETAAYTVCVTALLASLAGVRRDDRRGWDRAGTWLGAVAAMRPEGFLFALPVALHARRLGARRAEFARIALFAAALALPWVAFRLAYYGDWVPNPVRAKGNVAAAVAPGFVYVAKWATTVLLPLGLLGFARGWERARAAAAAIAIGIGFALAAGGDHLPGYRFMVPILPALAAVTALAMSSVPGKGRIWIPLALAAGSAGALRPDAFVGLVAPGLDLARVHRGLETHAVRLAVEVRHVGVALLALAIWGVVAARLRARPRALAAATLLACALPQWFDPDVRSCRVPDPAALYGRSVGIWMREHFPSGTLIATNAAGRLPYHAGLPVVDMLGLTDRTIARGRADAGQWIGHEKGDAAYVLSRRPDVIVLGGPEGSVEPWPFAGDRALAASAEFLRNYELRHAAVDGFEFVYYARRGFAPRP